MVGGTMYPQGAAKVTREEVEAIRDVFGADTKMTGFYSYGELSPFRQGGECRLHSQTMTITASPKRERRRCTDCSVAS
jgi:hypothetical protein